MVHKKLKFDEKLNKIVEKQRPWYLAMLVPLSAVIFSAYVGGTGKESETEKDIRSHRV